MIYLSNAFSLQMLSAGRAEASQIPAEGASQLVGIHTTDSGWSAGKDLHRGFTGKPYLPATSVIGHADICRVINHGLGLPARGLEYAVNRVSVALSPGDTLIVGQYVGPRLPEGATELPDGAEIRWYRVDIIGDDAIRQAEAHLARMEKITRRFESATYACTHTGCADQSPLMDAAEECFPSAFAEMME